MKLKYDILISKLVYRKIINDPVAILLEDLKNRDTIIILNTLSMELLLNLHPLFSKYLDYCFDIKIII